MVNSFAGLMEEKDLKNELYTNLLSLTLFFFSAYLLYSLVGKHPNSVPRIDFFNSRMLGGILTKLLPCLSNVLRNILISNSSLMAPSAYL